ncbi:hypothetical protein BD779DRAFT_1538962 [Infundibulicybe gibba]|nr:hypothetical protein BD779DRAFT_1538962 [Infundibulicybe gibba]
MSASGNVGKQIVCRYMRDLPFASVKGKFNCAIFAHQLLFTLSMCRCTSISPAVCTPPVIHTVHRSAWR